MRKVPKLYSVRQVAALTNRSRQTIRKSINTGRLLGAHWVDDRWVIQEDFRIIQAGVPMSGLVGLPPELISDEPEKDFDAELPHWVPTKTYAPYTTKHKVKAPGFARVTEGMTVREIRDITGLHNITQEKMKRGEPVQSIVVVRAAKRLGIDVEELLRA